MNKIKKYISVIIVLAMLLSLCACGEVKKEKYSKEIWGCFDTVITLMAYCKDEAEFNDMYKIASDSFNEYNKLFDIYSEYAGITNIKTINDNAGIKAVKVSDYIIGLLKLGKEMYSFTDGNVNIAFGSVLSLWHNAREYSQENPSKAYIPDIEDLKKKNEHSDIDSIVIDEEKSEVYISDKDTSIDVGAIAKGYATSLVTAQLKELGYSSFLITSGESSISAVGKKPDDTSWAALVRNDKESNVLLVSDYTISTSGIYQNNYYVDDVCYHHIINKDSLMPNQNFLSVTVISKDNGIGDALSTAIFNMDLDEGMKFINSKDDIYAFWIDLAGENYFSDGFDKFIRK